MTTSFPFEKRHVVTFLMALFWTLVFCCSAMNGKILEYSKERCSGCSACKTGAQGGFLGTESGGYASELGLSGETEPEGLVSELGRWQRCTRVNRSAVRPATIGE